MFCHRYPFDKLGAGLSQRASSTTIAHLACFKAGLVTFYGPAIMAGFAENVGMFPYMIESVRKILFHAEPIGTIAPNTNGRTRCLCCLMVSKPRSTVVLKNLPL